ESERRILAAPRSIAPIDYRPLMPAVLIAHDKNGPVIAAPRLVRWKMMEGNAFQQSLVFGQEPSHPFFHFRVPDVDVDFFHRDQVLDQFGVDGRHGVILSGKADTFGTRPTEPCA